MEELRLRFFEELKSKIERRIKSPIILFSRPKNGETIKLNGVVLYKILRVPNPWKKRGVAVYKRLTDSALDVIGGRRSKGRNKWIGCALTEANYSILMEILLETCEKATISRGIKMKDKHTGIIQKPKKINLKKGEK